MDSISLWSEPQFREPNKNNLSQKNRQHFSPLIQTLKIKTAQAFTEKWEHLPLLEPPKKTEGSKRKKISQRKGQHFPLVWAHNLENQNQKGSARKMGSISPFFEHKIVIFETAQNFHWRMGSICLCLNLKKPERSKRRKILPEKWTEFRSGLNLQFEIENKKNFSQKNGQHFPLFEHKKFEIRNSPNFHWKMRASGLAWTSKELTEHGQHVSLVNLENQNKKLCQKDGQHFPLLWTQNFDNRNSWKVLLKNEQHLPWLEPEKTERSKRWKKSPRKKDRIPSDLNPQFGIEKLKKFS